MVLSWPALRSALSCIVLLLPFIACESDGLATCSCPNVTLVWLPSFTQINASVATDNKAGLEDGIVVRRADGSFSLVAAEMWADPKWVSMRLGVFRSRDGLQWTRHRTLRESYGKLDGTPHSATWGPFFVHDPANNTWMLSYVGYRSASSNASGWLTNFDGTIYTRYADVEGDAGLDSAFGEANGTDPFHGDAVVLEPDDFNIDGPWPHQCQGLQGTDSFYPYQLADGTWAALVGTSMQQAGWQPSTNTPGKWPVSLATAPKLTGPWTRYNPNGDSRDAPCVDINGGKIENPIVTRRPDNRSAFIAVYDDLGLEGSGFGFSCSEDGFAWGQGRRVNIPGGTRTPLGVLAMTAAEVETHTADILEYGVLSDRSQLTSLQWLFYTVRDHSGWEGMRTAIVQTSCL